MLRFDDYCREERYFSATILPYLMAFENFAGLRVLLYYLNQKYLLFPETEIDLQNFENSLKSLQLITEPALERDLPHYGIQIPIDCFRLKKDKQSKPDMLIIFNDWAILFEAKYFTNYNSHDLYRQMSQQAYILEIVKAMSFNKIKHCIQLAICPIHENLKEFQTLTWDEIYNLMKSIIPEENYFMQRLKNSISRFNNL